MCPVVLLGCIFLNFVAVCGKFRFLVLPRTRKPLILLGFATPEFKFGGDGGIRITQRKIQSAQYVENRHVQDMEREDFILVSPLFPSNLFLIVVRIVVESFSPRSLTIPFTFQKLILRTL